jgi:hypothetical protein
VAGTTTESLFTYGIVEGNFAFDSSHAA